MSKPPNTSNNIVSRRDYFLVGWVLFCGLLLGSLNSMGQVDATLNIPDTTTTAGLDSNSNRILDVSDKLLLSSGFLVNSYTIDVKNTVEGNSVSLAPTGSINMGFGLNYRWFGIAFSFGLPTLNNDEKQNGETKKQDFQLNVYSNAFVAQGHLQHYKGFHVSNLNIGDSNSLNLSEGVGLMPSLETYSIGGSGWYFFNHKKFSYKAAYVRNAIQKKNAGSIVTGLYYGLDRAETKRTIGESLPDSLQDHFDVLGYTSQNYGVSIGYSYTFVIKNFFINATLVPGIGVKNVSLVTQSETYFIDEGLTARLSVNMALGYEAKQFIWGLRAFTSNRFFEAEGYRFNTGTNSVSIYVGKRFDVSNLVKRYK